MFNRGFVFNHTDNAVRLHIGADDVHHIFCGDDLTDAVRVQERIIGVGNTLYCMRIKLILIFSIAMIASGCAANGNTSSSDTGELNLYISDRPAEIDNFDYLNVTVSKVRLFAEVENSSNESFRSFNISETVDLTQLKGDNATSVLQESIEAGNYSKMELESSGIAAQVNGSSVEVKLPSGKLQLTKSFEVRPNETTEFVFDIQVALRGNQQNNQGYILRPVISQSGVVGKDVEIQRKDSSTGSNAEGGPPEQAGRPAP